MAAPLDPTFRNYDTKQATAYATHRKETYHITIIDEVIGGHESRGGKFGTVLDVGCGTGKAARSLGPRFDHVAACDPGEQMIAKAKQSPGLSKDGSEIAYEVLEAERLTKSTIVREGSVDLLTAAMAAHWFHMPDFWAQAARMVKPGGTVALWTMSSLYCHPSTPNATGVQAALSHLEDDILGPYELPQNRLSRRMYDDLPLPWAVQPSAARAFPKELFTRLEWDRLGQLEPGKDDFFSGSEAESLEEMAASLSTASMVTRWREANPDLVGGSNDCVSLATNAIADAMGVPKEGRDLGHINLRASGSTTLLLFTRSRED